VLDAALIARIIIIIAGLAVAIAAGLVFLPIAALVDPTIRAAGAAYSAFGIFALVASSFSWADPEPVGAALLLTLWTVTMMICVAPIVIVSLIGEVARTGSVLFYVMATGFVAAGLPWIAHIHHAGAPETANPVEGRLALLFFLTGACSGFVYWLIAGRGAERAAPHPRG
jgi:hypothetical protein